MEWPYQRSAKTYSLSITAQFLPRFMLAAHVNGISANGTLSTFIRSSIPSKDARWACNIASFAGNTVTAGGETPKNVIAALIPTSTPPKALRWSTLRKENNHCWETVKSLSERCEIVNWHTSTARVFGFFSWVFYQRIKQYTTKQTQLSTWRTMVGVNISKYGFKSKWSILGILQSSRFSFVSQA